MILNLSIENFIIIDSVNLKFNNNMNVIIGESGSGKSLIVDAISLLMGSRKQKDIIKNKAKKTMLKCTLIFENDDVELFLNSKNIVHDKNSIIITREFIHNKKNVIKINDNVITLKDLTYITSKIISINKQFESGNILLKNTTEVIDQFSKLNFNNIKKYKNCFNIYKKLLKEYNELILDNNSKHERLEFIKYQNNEILSLNLSEFEEINLKNKSLELSNQRDLIKFSDNLNKSFSNIDLNEILNIKNILDNLNLDYSKDFSIELEDIYYRLEDIKSSLLSRFENTSNYENEIDVIESRLYNIQRIKRQYSKTITELLDYNNKIEDEIFYLENLDGSLFEIKDKLLKYYNELLKNGENINDFRIKNCLEIEDKLNRELKDLKINNIKFKFKFEKLSNTNIYNNDICSNGLYNIDLLVSNNNEEYKKIKDSLSGGEMNRFVLAFKNIFKDKLLFNSIIFDEIDSGVSGEIAYKMAKKFKSISLNTQIIVISHLPQTLAISDNVILIQKEVNDKGIIIESSKLNDYKKQIELAKLLGNGDVNNSSLENAKYILNNI